MKVETSKQYIELILYSLNQQNVMHHVK